MPRKATADKAKTPARKRSRARAGRTKGSRTGHEVKLGRVAENGISASLLGLIERGAARRPTLAKELRGSVEIRFKEDFAHARATFHSGGILVEDAVQGSEEDKAFKPDLVISGSLPQIVQLTSGPLFGALARVAGRKVKIVGNPLLARRVLKLLEI